MAHHQRTGSNRFPPFALIVLKLILLNLSLAKQWGASTTLPGHLGNTLVIWRRGSRTFSTKTLCYADTANSLGFITISVNGIALYRMHPQQQLRLVRALHDRGTILSRFLKPGHRRPRLTMPLHSTKPLRSLFGMLRVLSAPSSNLSIHDGNKKQLS